MTAKRFTETLSTGIVTDNVTGKEYNCEMRIDDKLLELLNELHEENKEFKALLDKISDCNNEIWLDDGRIYRLRKAFKGEWVK